MKRKMSKNMIYHMYNQKSNSRSQKPIFNIWLLLKLGAITYQYARIETRLPRRYSRSHQPAQCKFLGSFT